MEGGTDKGSQVVLVLLLSSSDWPLIHNPLPQPSSGITGVYHHAQSQQVTFDALSIKFIFRLLFQYMRKKNAGEWTGHFIWQ